MNKPIKTLFALAGLALISMPAAAYEKGDWVVRAGIGMVQPESTAYSDAADDLRIIVDDGTAVSLSATYMLTPNWAFDILASTPFSHDIKAGPVSVPGEVKIGETKHLPPTFSIQYHFLPDGKFQPYAGLGLNYTLFFDEELDQALFPGFSLSIDDSVGVAAQIGADFKFNDRWLFNVDVRYISIEPDVTLSDGVTTDSPITIDINPIVFQLNLGYLF
jgi:outer membrane protein